MFRNWLQHSEEHKPDQMEFVLGRGPFRREFEPSNQRAYYFYPQCGKRHFYEIDRTYFAWTKSLAQYLEKELCTQVEISVPDEFVDLASKAGLHDNSTLYGREAEDTCKDGKTISIICDDIHAAWTLLLDTNISEDTLLSSLERFCANAGGSLTNDLN